MTGTPGRDADGIRGTGAHVVDELPTLLTGEASAELVRHAAAHLRTCADCQQELVATVVAHASLSSAQRFAPEVLGHDRITDVAASSHELATDPAPSEQAVPPALPDLGPVFAQIRAEAEADAVAHASSGTGAAPAAQRRRPGVRRGLLAAAAVAGLIVGGGGVALVTQDTGSSSRQAGRDVQLAAYGDGTTPASADIRTDGTMTIDASKVPAPRAGQRYEVWLTTASRTSMKPIGWIGANGRATLSVPANLMSRYSAIEVSVQSVDTTDYAYSGHSVLRGSYA